MSTEDKGKAPIEVTNEEQLLKNFENIMKTSMNTVK